jgi:hypothetical protein
LLKIAQELDPNGESYLLRDVDHRSHGKRSKWMQRYEDLEEIMLKATEQGSETFIASMRKTLNIVWGKLSIKEQEYINENR